MKNFIKKNKLNWVLTIFLLIGSAFSVVTVVSAVAPNPGHTWSEVGDVLVNLATQVTGTLGTAHLGAGTADTTTFLRGDGSWATPAGGVGGTYTPLLIGGTAVDSNIIYKSTTGVGIVEAIAHQFTGGNNGGTVIATMLNNGKVGIGTTTPAELLHIKAVTGANDAKLIIQAGGEANDSHLVLSTGDTGRDSRKTAIVAEGITSFNRADLHFVLNPNMNDSNYVLGTDTKMIIKNNGNVGIGTVAPSGILSVTPTYYNTGTASQSLTTVTGVGTTFTSGMVGSQFVYANGVSAGTITAFTNTTTLTVSTSQTVASQAYKIASTGLQVSTAGNVSIGTTTAITGKLLTVSNMASPYSMAAANGIALSLSNGGGIYMNSGGLGGVDGKYEAYGNALGVGTMSSHPLEFFTNDTEKMRIDTSGNVGIQTTGPTANFQVGQTGAGAGTVTTNGTTSVIGVGTQFLNTFKVGDIIRVNGEARTIASIASNTSLTTDTWTGSFSDFAYTLPGRLSFSVLGNGNVGIGMTNPASHLQIGGNVSTASWTTTGIAFDSKGATYTDTSTANGGTVAVRTANSFSAPAFASTNPITVTDAFSLYVPKPNTGANTTITRANSAYFGGNVGIGTTSPTAVLHLKAGTATASTAPLKFQSGTDLTTVETGAVEYDGTNLHFTPSGTLRENIHFGSKGSATLTAGTTTTITTAGAKTTSVILIQPRSAAITLLGVYVSSKSNGSFVLTHGGAAGTETFDWVIIN